jgi:hypothetical protein
MLPESTAHCGWLTMKRFTSRVTNSLTNRVTSYSILSLSIPISAVDIVFTRMRHSQPILRPPLGLLNLMPIAHDPCDRRAPRHVPFARHRDAPLWTALSKKEARTVPVVQPKTCSYRLTGCPAHRGRSHSDRAAKTPAMAAFAAPVCDCVTIPQVPGTGPKTSSWNRTWSATSCQFASTRSGSACNCTVVLALSPARYNALFRGTRDPTCSGFDHLRRLCEGGVYKAHIEAAHSRRLGGVPRWSI